MIGGMWLWGLLIVGLVILAVFCLSKFTVNSGVNKETPLEIAKRRLAQGDISKEEFEEIIKQL